MGRGIFNGLLNNNEAEWKNGARHVARPLLKHTKIVQLFFNNHAKSQATVNAKKIGMLMKQYL